MQNWEEGLEGKRRNVRRWVTLMLGDLDKVGQSDEFYPASDSASSGNRNLREHKCASIDCRHDTLCIVKQINPNNDELPIPCTFPLFLYPNRSIIYGNVPLTRVQSSSR